MITYHRANTFQETELPLLNELLVMSIASQRGAPLSFLTHISTGRCSQAGFKNRKCIYACAAEIKIDGISALLKYASVSTLPTGSSIRQSLLILELTLLAGRCIATSSIILRFV